MVLERQGLSELLDQKVRRHPENTSAQVTQRGGPMSPLPQGPWHAPEIEGKLDRRVWFPGSQWAMGRGTGLAGGPPLSPHPLLPIVLVN